jgi:hypothetical protein
LSQLATVGFDVIPAVLIDAEVDALCIAAATFTRSRAGARHLMRDAHVNGVARDRRLLDVASAALGSRAEPYRATPCACTSTIRPRRTDRCASSRALTSWAS